MARKQLAALLAFLVIIGPVTYFVVKEELRQSHRMRSLQSYPPLQSEDVAGAESKRPIRASEDLDTLTKSKNRELFKRLRHSRHQEKVLQDKIIELNTKLSGCTNHAHVQNNVPTVVPTPLSENKTIPRIFVITPTYKRYVQKAELTRLWQAFKGVPKLHWIVVEDSSHKTQLVKDFLKRTGLPYTHLNIRTPDLLRKHKGERRRFKPRGVFQRNIGIEWIRNEIDPADTPGVVYFADDDNTYDSALFEEMRWIKGVGVWPVGFIGAARWGGPVCKHGKVVKFHTNWGKFRPFPIDMAGFAININKLLVEFPKAKFKAMKKPGMLESSLLKQITSKKELEPVANECTKVYVWHTRSQQPRDSIIGEKELIRKGRPSDLNIET